VLPLSFSLYLTSLVLLLFFFGEKNMIKRREDIAAAEAQRLSRDTEAAAEAAEATAER
jgi:hypothetical protein